MEQREKQSKIVKDAAGEARRNAAYESEAEDYSVSANRRAAERRRRQEERQKQLRKTYAIIGCGFVLLLALALFLILKPGSGSSNKSGNQIAQNQQQNQDGQIQNEQDGSLEPVGDAEGEEAAEAVQPEAAPATLEDIVALADRKAAMYDYDGAIALLKEQEGYAEDAQLQEKTAGYQKSKDACVAIDPLEVSHVFVHSLIVDPSRAFDGESNQDGYNKNMVTLEEFKKIIQSMYDNGYVLVSPHDMGEIDANGLMQKKNIYLPEGKKPVIFSQDDVSYYHSYDNDGFPDKLMIDENGKVKNQYTDVDGNVTIGDYDMVPVIDTFVEEHPDFSYRGMKGIVVLTGYNGVLGYHTDGDYRDRLNLQLDQKTWLEEHPDFDFDADVAEATRVATAMKEAGWEFASHTWGHISVSDASLESLQKDTEKWLEYVSPIIGGTDMIIFAFGADIGDWTGYADDNAKFNYLKSVGFDYFCNVDGSTLSWVQFGSRYLRTGRMNVDGYRMSANPEKLAPLFDVSQVYDYSRPPMPAW